MFMYYDYTHQLCFAFNPLAPSESSIVSDDPMEVPTNELKEGLTAPLAEYLEKNYGSGKALFQVTTDGADTTTIVISSHSYKIEAFWTGIWLSTWTLSGGQLSGSIKAKNHYFEIGNMQMNLDKEFDAIPVKNITDPSSVVAAI